MTSISPTELSAKNILVVNRHEDYEKSQNQFYKMCEYAGGDIRICLEFGEFTNIKSLKHAQKFINSINHSSSGILIDLMHINRSNEELPELSNSIYPYVQGCDFWQSSKIPSTATLKTLGASTVVKNFL